MDPVQSGFPVLQVASCSITLAPLARQTQGVGGFGTTLPSGSLTNLVIAFPAGRSDAKSIEFLRELCVQHLLNNQALVEWWNPVSGSIESNLREALNLTQIPHAYTTAINWGLMFDGQYGPVLVA